MPAGATATDGETRSTRPVPAWYEDAKLGVIIHWGPYSVPAWAPLTGELPTVIAKYGWEHWFAHNPYAEWYANSMLLSGSPTREHHRARWGRLTRYESFGRQLRQGLKDWDPAAWMDPICASGARYVVFTAKHHDGFLMWPARRRNPRRRAWQVSRDIVGELAREVRARGIRFGLYYSGGLDWTFGGLPIRSHADLVGATPRSKGYAAYVDAHWRELIARYAPSVLWNDIGSPRSEDLQGLFASYYGAVPDGVVNDRFGQHGAGDPAGFRRWVATALARVLAPLRAGQAARGLSAPAMEHADFTTAEYAAAPSTPGPEGGAWECVRGLGCSFGANTLETSESLIPLHSLVRLLIDVVAGGGNLLLGVGPAADGTLSEAQRGLLSGLGQWLKLNGEAIFGTRPWGEESTTPDGIPVRCTARGMTAYAILEGTPADRTIVLPGLRLAPYAGVRIIGSMSYVAWFQVGRDVHIRLTEPLRDSPAHVISMTPRPRA